MNEFLTAVTQDVDALLDRRRSRTPGSTSRASPTPGSPPARRASARAADARRQRRRVLPGRRHDLHLRAVRRPRSTTAARPVAARQLQGYGGTYGDFAVAYIVAHEYGHQIQDELGLYDKYGDQLPTSAFELQADCYAGTWANNANQEQPARGRRRAGGARRRARRRRLRREQPAATTARPSSARTPGTPASSPAIPAACNQFLSA